MPFADVDKVAKLIPPALDMTLDKALEENPALKEMEQNDPKVKELLDVGAAPRGHDAPRLGARRRRRDRAAAPITEFAPLYKGARRRNRHAVGHEGDRARSASSRWTSSA